MYVHFIAIGGSVMHQLAIALKLHGYRVTGSDDEIFEPAQSNLRRAGILPKSLGWFPEQLTSDIDAVILGMHAKPDNPELLQAKALGVKIYSFPEYIYQESIRKKRVAIGGSHGKTSTTAMIMHVLQKFGFHFDYLVGARLEGFAQSVNISGAPVIICEADEYPASAIESRPKFHFLHPHIAVLTGIAWDHINVFPTFENYLLQFEIFIQMIEPGGILVYNNNDDTLSALVNKQIRSDITYKPYHLPTYFIEDGRTDVTIEGQKGTLQVFGNHNLLNLSAAWLVCQELKIDAATFVSHISSFKGASKRLELLCSNKNLNIYRDFAHAPSKVKAAIEAVNQQFPDRKLIAVLELHTYSSLNSEFLQEYKFSMENAGSAAVFYSSHALELKGMPTLSPAMVTEGFSKDGLQVFNIKQDLEKWLLRQDYNNTNLLMMSSGNFEGLDVQDIINYKLAPLKQEDTLGKV